MKDLPYLVLSLFFLLSCGNSQSASDNDTNSTIKIKKNDNGSVELTIKPEDVSGKVTWIFQEIKDESTKGECILETADINDEKAIFFKDGEVSPFCEQFELDPISTVQKIVVTSKGQAIEFCIKTNNINRCSRSY